jgi:sugar transferase (PEP-CTERM/EpsH1 system associated)
MLDDLIRVLHLITELSVGGAQSVLTCLLAGSDRQRYSPLVVALYNANGVAARQVRTLGVPVIDLGMNSKARLDAVWRLYRLLSQTRPTILHAWMIHSNLLARVVGRLAGVPIIVTSRRNVHIGGKGRELLKRATAWMDDRVIAVCEAARQAEIQRSGVSPDKVVTIHNGIDVRRFSAEKRSRHCVRNTFGVPHDALLIGAIGRLHAQKGFPYLLRATAELVTRMPHVRLLVVGEGELRRLLGDQCQDLGLAETVTFAGLRTDVPQILSSLDLLVLPSLWEGMPNVVLEAMAAELPVVATTVGGTPEVVVDGETGILVPAADVEALARAIERLLSDCALRQRMGQAGRKRIEEHFTVAQMVRKTENLYEQLLVEKGYDC